MLLRIEEGSGPEEISLFQTRDAERRVRGDLARHPIV
jgi:hypothetical protein